MITRDKITEIFCAVDEFCKLYEYETAKSALIDAFGKKRRNRKARLSDSEIITILLMYHFGSFRNFKHFYLIYICQSMRRDFPDVVSYNRFNELQGRVFFKMMFFCKLVAFGHCTGVSYADSTMIPVCHNVRRYMNKVFKGIAKDGKGTMGWCHGFKLHLVCNDRGEIITFCLTPANVDDRDLGVWKVLSKELYGKLFADRGYISQKLFDYLFPDGIQVITGLKGNMKNKLMPLWDKLELRKRYVIELINDQLKNKANLVHSRHRSINGFLINLISAMGAYCFFDNKPDALDVHIEPTMQLEFW
ncbi:MAG: IS982 family transposase [Prevotella sp.]|nr:IS982 family transposase [Candidatus Equicola faecalis]